MRPLGVAVRLVFPGDPDGTVQLDHLGRLMRSGQPDVQPMPVGQIVGRMNEVRPVAELIKTLLQEVDDALNRPGRLR